MMAKEAHISAKEANQTVSDPFFNPREAEFTPRTDYKSPVIDFQMGGMISNKDL